MTQLDFNQAYLDAVMFSPEVLRQQEALGRKVLANAKASAPVDTAAYKRSIKMTTVRRRHRNAVIVEATDPKSLMIEAKTGNLARALKSAGRG